KFQVSEALTFRKSARPSISVLGFDALRSETLTARKVGASALFGGGGGDQLFFRTPAILTATDYVFRRGLRLPLLRVALSSAYLEKYSIWKVLWTAIRDGSKAKRPDPWVNADFYNYRKLVRPEIIETFREQQRFLHPWFRSTAPVPPGTLDQIFSCSFPIPFYDYSA